MGDHEVGKEMGINTWAAFPVASNKPIVDGDFAMLEGECKACSRLCAGQHQHCGDFTNT